MPNKVNENISGGQVGEGSIAFIALIEPDRKRNVNLGEKATIAHPYSDQQPIRRDDHANAQQIVRPDISQMMTKCHWAWPKGQKTEAEGTRMKGMLGRLAADRDFVTAKNFDAVRAMPQKAPQETKP